MFGLTRKKPKPETADAVFPVIDVDTLARSLRLQARGLENGRAERPTSTDQQPDAVERDIIASVSKLRRDGLDDFSEQSKVYRERLNRFHLIDADIQNAINKTKTDAQAATLTLRNELKDARSDFQRMEVELAEFKENNRIYRTGHRESGIVKWLLVCLVIVLFESALNGVFFADVHALGLIGGISVALAISGVNVGVASVFGHLYRNKNHISPINKIIGHVSLLAGVVLGLGINFFVGHFRDAATTASWDDAAGQAWEQVSMGQVWMQSLDAWLLAALGIVIAAFAGWKAYSAFDPYPGYGRVWKKYEDKRRDWRGKIEDAVEQIQAISEEANDSLKAARQDLQARRGDAISSYEGLVDLIAKRKVFLDDCSNVIDRLLSIYRDANLKARETPTPGCFSQSHDFPDDSPPEPPVQPDPEELRRCETMVTKAMDEVHGICQSAMTAIEQDRADAIEGTGRG